MNKTEEIFIDHGGKTIEPAKLGKYEYPGTYADNLAREVQDLSRDMQKIFDRWSMIGVEIHDFTRYFQNTRDTPQHRHVVKGMKNIKDRYDEVVDDYASAYSKVPRLISNLLDVSKYADETTHYDR